MRKNVVSLFVRWWTTPSNERFYKSPDAIDEKHKEKIGEVEALGKMVFIQRAPEKNR